MQTASDHSHKDPSPPSFSQRLLTLEFLMDFALVPADSKRNKWTPCYLWLSFPNSLFCRPCIAFQPVDSTSLWLGRTSRWRLYKNPFSGALSPQFLSTFSEPLPPSPHHVLQSRPRCPRRFYPRGCHADRERWPRARYVSTTSLVTPARRSSSLNLALLSPIPISQCNTGNAQCCNSATQATSPAAKTQLGLLGLVVQGVDVLLGLVDLNLHLSKHQLTLAYRFTCTPINVAAFAGAADCSQKPLCCENNNFGGAVSAYLASTILSISCQLRSASVAPRLPFEFRHLARR
jgi:hypothetical protein